MHNKCGITQSTRVASTSCRQKTYKENVRCIVTETTLSLLISQRSLCCMLCGRRKVRMTKVQLSASSWHIQPGRNEQQWQRRATVCCQRGQTLPESQARESAHVLNEPGSNHSTISLTTDPFRAITFSRTRYHVFLLCMSLSFSA